MNLEPFKHTFNFTLYPELGEPAGTASGLTHLDQTMTANEENPCQPDVVMNAVWKELQPATDVAHMKSRRLFLNSVCTVMEDLESENLARVSGVYKIIQNEIEEFLEQLSRCRGTFRRLVHKTFKLMEDQVECYETNAKVLEAAAEAARAMSTRHTWEMLENVFPLSTEPLRL